VTGAGVRKFCVATALVVSVSRAGSVRAEPASTIPSVLPLDIATDTSCPAPDAVGRALAEILGLSASERLNEVARLAHADAGVVVTLHDRDGRLLGERTLPLEATCDELARAAAVVLATCLSDAHPEFVPRMTQRASPAANGANSEPNGVDSEPDDVDSEPDGVDSEPDDVNSEPNGAKPVAGAPPSGEIHSRGSMRFEREWRLRVAAAVGASVLPAPAAFAGTLSAVFVPDHGGVGATLRASALSSRERDVPGGKVRYLRWPLEAGATLRFATASVAFELDGGGALGWLHVAGRSFSPNRSADDVTFGPFAAARVLAARGRVQPFAELAGLFWLRSARVYADATQPSVALSRGEMTLSLGAAFVP
jgi:hypothetical protein